MGSSMLGYRQLIIITLVQVRRARQKAVKFLEGISRNLSSDRERSNVERQVSSCLECPSSILHAHQLTSLLTGQSQSTERLTQMCIDLGEDKQGLEEEARHLLLSIQVGLFRLRRGEQS